MTQPGDITARLQAWADGDESVRDPAVDAAYDEMRQIAHRRMRAEPHGMTFDATGLADEALARLVEQRLVQRQHRLRFLLVAGRLMRRILVHRHRASNAQQRGDRGSRVTVADAGGVAAPVAFDLELLDRSLDRFAVQDARSAQIVELRYFGGVSIEDTADAVGVSPATVEREWMLARAWLKRELDDGG